MIDNTFGSTYIQSAIDLAVQAASQLENRPGVVSNPKEALRLLRAACADIRAGMLELAGLGPTHYLAARVPTLTDECHRRLTGWQDLIDKLREST